MFVCFVLCFVFFPFAGRGTSVRNSLKFANICNKKNGDKKWIDVSSNKRTRTNCFLAKRLQERLSAFENYPLLFWAHNRFYIIEPIRVKRDRTSLGKPCLVPRPHYYSPSDAFRVTWSEKVFDGVSRPFVSDTSSKCIDREGLERRRIGTRQRQAYCAYCSRETLITYGGRHLISMEEV